MSNNASLESSRVIRLGWVNEDFPLLFRQPTGGWSPSSSGWTGVLGLLDRGEADATLERFSFRSERIRAFAVTVPVLYSKDAFFDTRRQTQGRDSMHLFVYSPTVLALLFLSIFFAATVEKAVLSLRRCILQGETASLAGFTRMFFLSSPPFYQCFLPFQCYRHTVAIYMVALLMLLMGFQSTFKSTSNILVFQQTDFNNFVAGLRSSEKAIVVTDPTMIYDEQIMELYGEDVRNDPWRLQIEPDISRMALRACEDARVFAYVPDYRLATPNPRTNYKPPCDFVAIDVSNAPHSSNTANAMRQSWPFAFYFRRGFLSTAEANKLNRMLLRMYDYDTIYTFEWRYWTNRPFKKFRPTIKDAMAEEAVNDAFWGDTEENAVPTSRTDHEPRTEPRILSLGWVNEDFPVLYHDSDGIMRGIFVDMFTNFAKKFNLELRFVRGDGYGGWNAGTDGKWAGLLGLIQNGTISATLDKYSYREGRIRGFRYSLPVLYSKDTFFDSRSSTDQGAMSIDYLVYPITVFYYIVGSFLLILFIERIIFVLRMSLKGRRPVRPRLKHKIIDFWKDYIFLRPSIASFFEPPQVHIGTFALYLLAMQVLFVTWNAEFQGNSNIVVFTRTTFTQLVDDLRAGTKALAVTSPSLIYDEQMLELYGMNVRHDSSRLKIVPNYDDMAVLVCEDARVLAYVPDYRLSTVNPAKAFRPPCDFVEVDASHAPSNIKTVDAIKQEQPFAFYFDRRIPRKYADWFNQVVLRVFDYDKIYAHFWRQYTNRAMKKTSPSKEVGASAVKLNRIDGIFVTLIYGLSMSIAVFLLEIFYARFGERRIFVSGAALSSHEYQTQSTSSLYGSLRLLFSGRWLPVDVRRRRGGWLGRFVEKHFPDKHYPCLIQ